MTTVQLFDTMTGEKAPFTPLEPGRVGVYCCGPTVYDLSHVGHMRAALAPDMVVRLFRYEGLEVKYVRNITDVDDKIIKRANERGEDPVALAERYRQAYEEDLAALNMLVPDVIPTVTAHMTQIIDLISMLEEKGLAYAVDGDVFYAVDGFPPYGKLSRRKLDDQRSGARVEVDTRKRSPHDFALWKSAKADEPSWDSPWGPGRPGWHIECSAMIRAHLGETFDLHCGGRDLIFPHHENEIAQSEGAFGEGSFAKRWLHNGFVNFDGEKMSKSLGNFFTVREVLQLYHPEPLRYLLLSVHYRSAVNFEAEVRCPTCNVLLTREEQQAGRCSNGHEFGQDVLRQQVRFPGLEEADDRVAYVYDTVVRVQTFLSTAKDPGDGDVLPSVGGMVEAFVSALRDDINTSEAFAALSAPLNDVNRLLDSGKGVDKKVRARTLKRFRDDLAVVAQLTGVFGRAPEAFLVARRDLKAARIGLDVDRVERLMADRAQARRDKDFARADEVRGELQALGVDVRDNPGGSIWTL